MCVGGGKKYDERWIGVKRRGRARWERGEIERERESKWAQ